MRTSNTLRFCGVHQLRRPGAVLRRKKYCHRKRIHMLLFIFFSKVLFEVHPKGPVSRDFLFLFLSKYRYSTVPGLLMNKLEQMHIVLRQNVPRDISGSSTKQAKKGRRGRVEYTTNKTSQGTIRP